MYRGLLVAVVVLHFGYIAYLALGGFVAWRWPRTVWLHLAAVGWGSATLSCGLPCPLTAVEDALRHRIGLAPLGPEGFAGHYVAYESQRGLVRAAFVAMVLGSWLTLLRRRTGAYKGVVDYSDSPIEARSGPCG
jgi:hypothetical protein